MRALILLLVICNLGYIESFSPVFQSLRQKPDHSPVTLHLASKGTKPKPVGKQTNKGRRSKPNAKKLKVGDSQVSRRRVRPSGPRPVVTDYEMNTDPFVLEQRMTGAINCQHFGECAGCVKDEAVADVDIVQSAKFYFSSTSIRRKRKDILRRGLPFATEEKDDGFYQVVIPSGIQQWRTQAKLAVAPKSSGWANDGCQFGLYRRGTHRVLEIPSCSVHHPAVNEAVRVLQAATTKARIAAYQDSTQERGLRYVQLQVERMTGKVALTLVWNTETLKQTQPALSRLIKTLTASAPDLWHSIWCHCNDGLGNNIFARNPRRWHRISGPEYLREPIPTTNQGWLYFSPLTFRQGNLDGFDIIAGDVARAVPGGSNVCELYAGVGLLGLSALTYHADEPNGSKPLGWIRCSDENPSNSKCFKRSVDSLALDVTGRDRTSGSRKKEAEEKTYTLAELAEMMESGRSPNFEEELQEKATYKVASAGEALAAGQALGANVMIVDPPRKGLCEDVLNELCKPFNPDQPYAESATTLIMSDERVNWANDVEKLVYVSCGFDALARDCERLLSGPGGWVLESATGYVLFPGSNHVETLAIFTRTI